jgi:hypothetical protein
MNEHWSEEESQSEEEEMSEYEEELPRPDETQGAADSLEVQQEEQPSPARVATPLPGTRAELSPGVGEQGNQEQSAPEAASWEGEQLPAPQLVREDREADINKDDRLRQAVARGKAANAKLAEVEEAQELLAAAREVAATEGELLNIAAAEEMVRTLLEDAKELVAAANELIALYKEAASPKGEDICIKEQCEPRTRAAVLECKQPQEQVVSLVAAQTTRTLELSEESEEEAVHLTGGGEEHPTTGSLTLLREQQFLGKDATDQEQLYTAGKARGQQQLLPTPEPPATGQQISG